MPMTQSDLVIRRAALEDAPSLAKLAADSFRDAYYPLDDHDEIDSYIAEHFSLEAIASTLADPNSTVLLASQLDRWIGYAHLSIEQAPDCVVGPAPIQLARLYFVREAVGKGNGSRLMRAVFEEVRRLCRRTIWLGIHSQNVQALAFYKKFGFVHVGGKPFVIAGQSYVDPCLAMTMPLEELP
jgi:GNAT superfamily N-acetyltransferase